MRVRGGAGLATAIVAIAALGGCGAGRPPDPDASPTPVATAPTEARAQLAALVALAKDRRMQAFYTLRSRGRPDRTIAVTLAGDRTWRIDIPGGALGGTVDVAFASAAGGIYQCTLPSTKQPGAGCVRVADASGELPASIDPRVTHAFTDWRDVLTDRHAPLSIAAARPPTGGTGACYSVELTSASMAAPMDAGIYCYAPDGTLTAVVAGFGTLVLVAEPAAAPPTVPLPGPVVAAAPLRTAAPPSPSPTAARP